MISNVETSLINAHYVVILMNVRFAEINNAFWRMHDIHVPVSFLSGDADASEPTP